MEKKLKPVVEICRCGRATEHHLACDEYHAHEYPKCGVDVCAACLFNIKVCKCAPLKKAGR